MRCLSFLLACQKRIHLWCPSFPPAFQRKSLTKSLSSLLACQRKQQTSLPCYPLVCQTKIQTKLWCLSFLLFCRKKIHLWCPSFPLVCRKKIHLWCPSFPLAYQTKIQTKMWCLSFPRVFQKRWLMLPSSPVVFQTRILSWQQSPSFPLACRRRSWEQRLSCQEHFQTKEKVCLSFHSAGRKRIQKQAYSWTLQAWKKKSLSLGSLSYLCCQKKMLTEWSLCPSCRRACQTSWIGPKIQTAPRR